MTVLDALNQSLSRAGEFNRDDQVAPAVILWPDKERQWEPVLPVLRESLAHLLTLGAYDVGTRTGPAVWLRCMMARTLPEATWTEKDIPVIYLPGVSRQELRAVPVSARKQLNDLPDDLITKVNILYYTDSREALLKAIVE